jgi:hypothetical protein
MIDGGLVGEKESRIAQVKECDFRDFGTKTPIKRPTFSKSFVC